MRTISYFTLCFLMLLTFSTCFNAQDSTQKQKEVTEKEIKELEKSIELKKRKLALLEKEQEIDKKIKSYKQKNGAATQPKNTSGSKPVADSVKLKASKKNKMVSPILPASPARPSTSSGISSIVPIGSAKTTTPSSLPQTSPTPQTIEDVATNLAKQIFEVLQDDLKTNSTSKPQIDLTDQSSDVIKLFEKKIVETEKKKKEEIEKELTGNDKKNQKVVLDTEAVRSDKLLGATSKSNGTTSLLSKGGIPLIFSLATEYGGAVSSTSGTSTTFQFNPVGLSDFLTRRPEFPDDNKLTCKEETDLRNFLCRTSIGLTFDLNRGIETPEFTGSGEQLSQLSFRYELLKKREPNVSEFKSNTEAFLNRALIPVSTAQFQSLSQLTNSNSEFTNAELQKWIIETNGELKKLSLTGDDKNKEAIIRKAIISSLEKLPVHKILEDENTTNALRSFGDASTLYRKAKENYLEDLYREWMLTFEYVNKRELNSPDSSNFLLIAEKGFGNGLDFTFNGSFALFHSRPEANAMMLGLNEDLENFKRLRDFSFATQLDVPLFGIPSLKNSTFSLAAKYQRMNTDVFVFNNISFNDLKGDIWVGQAKLNLGIGKSGFFLPLSLTYANRTELVKEKESRGNFGFTFDVSSMLKRYISGLFQ